MCISLSANEISFLDLIIRIIQKYLGQLNRHRHRQLPRVNWLVVTVNRLLAELRPEPEFQDQYLIPCLIRKSIDITKQVSTRWILNKD